ncbi:MAG: DUF4230 domain-containing protein [Anaerovoracaceae bacterium]
MKKRAVWIIAAAVAAGLVLGFLISGPAGEAAARKKESKALTDRLSSAEELSSIEYDYRNAVKLESSRQLFESLDIPFTKKEIVMTYSGVMKIGIDMSKVSVSVKRSGGDVSGVRVTLPDVKILSNEIDRDSIDFPIETQGLGNSIKTADYSKLEKQADSDIRDSVRDSSVMDQAESEVKSDISGYLKSLYGSDIKVSFD